MTDLTQNDIEALGGLCLYLYNQMRFDSGEEAIICGMLVSQWQESLDPPLEEHIYFPVTTTSSSLFKVVLKGGAIQHTEQVR